MNVSEQYLNLAVDEKIDSTGSEQLRPSRRRGI